MFLKIVHAKMSSLKVFFVKYLYNSTFLHTALIPQNVLRSTTKVLKLVSWAHSPSYKMSPWQPNLSPHLIGLLIRYDDTQHMLFINSLKNVKLI